MLIRKTILCRYIFLDSFHFLILTKYNTNRLWFWTQTATVETRGKIPNWQHILDNFYFLIFILNVNRYCRLNPVKPCNIVGTILPTFSKSTYHENISTPFLIKCLNHSKIIEHFQKWNIYCSGVQAKFKQRKNLIHHAPNIFQHISTLLKISLLRYQYLIKQISSSNN